MPVIVHLCPTPTPPPLPCDQMLDILEDYIRMRNWKYKRLDGSTNRIQRMIDIQQFNKPK